MAKSIKLRQGTADEHAAFTGAMAEVTFDTTNNTVVLHDGVTVGGIPMAKLSDVPVDLTDLTDVDGNLPSGTGGAAAFSGTTYVVTVASGTNTYGTGNKYYIAGFVDASPTVTLTEGETYRFDQSDSTNTGHPLKFSTTANGTHDSGSEYTTGVTYNGVPGQANAYTEITVEVGAPTLYYYCQNHSGMGSVPAAEGALDVESVFSTDLYTGNGSTRTINNGIDLDGEGGLVWIKARTTAFSSVLFDTNRGFGNYILSDQPLKENFAGDLGWTGGTFNTNGFTLPNDSNGSINGSYDYVSWTFRNASTFFDSLTYNSSSGNVTNFGSAGATVDHSLGSVPDLIIAKCIDTSSTNWRVYHSGLNGGTNPEEYEIYLNLTSAEVQSSSTWYDTAPTSTQFTLGYANDINGDVNTVSSSYTAYLFASLDGISKVGSYTGNGTNQTIDCGFTAGARFILVKRTDSTGDWYVWDTERGVVSLNDPHLSFNAASAEVTSDDSIDPDSSGFIVNQVSPSNINVSSAKYIFYAIA